MIKSMNKDLFEKLCDEGLAYIYVIKLYDEVESFYKIGITSKENTYDRVSSFPYKVEIIDVFCHPSPGFIMDLEKHLLSLEEKYMPLKMFGGYSECVKSADKAVEFLNSLSWMKDFKQHKLLKKHTFSGLVREYLDNLDTGYLDLLKRDKRSAIIEEAIEIFGADSIRELSQRKISHAILEEKILEYKQEVVITGLLRERFKENETLSSFEIKRKLEHIFISFKFSVRPKVSLLSLAFNISYTSFKKSDVQIHAVKIMDYKHQHFDVSEEYKEMFSRHREVGLKMLCDAYERNPEECKEISPEWFPMIDELGVDRVISCGYKKTNVKALYDHIKKASDESTTNRIYRTFKVGETYSNTFIKKKLQSFGLAKAKASTLAEYFEIKKGKTKDRKDGYKIMRGL